MSQLSVCLSALDEDGLASAFREIGEAFQHQLLLQTLFGCKTTLLFFALDPAGLAEGVLWLEVLLVLCGQSKPYGERDVRLVQQCVVSRAKAVFAEQFRLHGVALAAVPVQVSLSLADWSGRG
ncbi:hypothetical protein THUN1379_24670 [Paludibacterium sp. THUN1379]|uniref:hypothetical protein n=1 Tax=Paludibacterium sp. THUN1379 TaxID=3112107 RepID=UPI003086099D|nr:hypothetical protein THUN1379_24670 [Paludibacterium sp. THUN1379]